MYTAEEQRHLDDVRRLSEALEATLQSWMAQEEKRPVDAAVPGGLAEFAARTLGLCLREIPAGRREEWLQGWLTFLSARLQAERGGTTMGPP